MRYLILVVVLLCSSCNNNPHADESKASFDSALAIKLGADAYGMKKYVMAFLKKGKHVILDSAEKEAMQQAHLNNIIRLAKEGKLIVAGPFLDDGALRGIFIFDVDNVAEAEKLCASDPMIKTGSLEMELHPWYGSAALVQAATLHRRIEKKSVAD